MAGKLVPASIALATGSLALGAALGSLGAWAMVVLALGGLWYLGQRRGWDWVSSLGLMLSAAAATAGLYLGLAPGWMLLGVVGALTAWDLHGLERSLEEVRLVEGTRDLERRHLYRLLVVDLLGLLVAGVALEIEVRLSFGLVMVMGLLVMVGMAQLIRLLRGDGS
ncbi:hypothetical protein ACFLT5_00785 [Chloroflexota bacterium]